MSIGEAFAYAFGRAYALGKQTETITQEDVEKAAEKHADELRVPSTIPGVIVPMLHDIAKSSYICGAQDTLGKQERDEGTVISGWVARDKDGDVPLFVGEGKPYRNKYGDFISVPTLYLPRNEFPDIVSDREPIEVEIIIKRKKNGRV